MATPPTRPSGRKRERTSRDEPPTEKIKSSTGNATNENDIHPHSSTSCAAPAMRSIQQDDNLGRGKRFRPPVDFYSDIFDDTDFHSSDQSDDSSSSTDLESDEEIASTSAASETDSLMEGNESEHDDDFQDDDGSEESEHVRGDGVVEGMDSASDTAAPPATTGSEERTALADGRAVESALPVVQHVMLEDTPPTYNEAIQSAQPLSQTLRTRLAAANNQVQLHAEELAAKDGLIISLQSELQTARARLTRRTTELTAANRECERTKDELYKQKRIVVAAKNATKMGGLATWGEIGRRMSGLSEAVRDAEDQLL